MEETIKLLQLTQIGDKAAREQLVLNNMGLIWSVVRRFANRGYESEDLFQIGCIGLIKAIDNFDEKFNVKFSTYAVPMITGEIKRFMRDDGIIKISRNIKENQGKILKSKEELQKKLGRESTIAEVSKDTGIPIEDVLTAINAFNEVESLNKVIYHGESSEITLMEKIDEGKENNEAIINKLLISDLLDQITTRERMVIHMRYYQDKTQSEVAKVLKMSQVQVSRMEKKILLQLRKKVE